MAAQAPQVRTIAVIGGDDRAKNYTWPDDMEVRHYGTDDVDKLERALRAGSIAHTIVVTKFVSHSAENVVRGTGVPFTRWPHGFNELIKLLPTMLPALRAPENDNRKVLDAFPDVEEREPPPSQPEGPRRPPEDIVVERTRDYSAALVAARKASRYVTELKEEIERAETAAAEAEVKLKKAHEELLAAAALI